MSASQEHNVLAVGAGDFDNFNTLWALAQNYFEKGEADYFAMLHADVTPPACFLDVLAKEMENKKVSLVSAVIPIKDNRGLTSCGIGDFNDRWAPFRRITVKELDQLPKTFTAADYGYPDGILLHNNGCWIADLRDHRFRSVDENGHLKAIFNFPKRIIRNVHGLWEPSGESEDWYFSREIHDLGIPSAITQLLECQHMGSHIYSSAARWGNEHDEDLRSKWDSGKNSKSA